MRFLNARFGDNGKLWHVLVAMAVSLAMWALIIIGVGSAVKAEEPPPDPYPGLTEEQLNEVQCFDHGLDEPVCYTLRELIDMTRDEPLLCEDYADDEPRPNGCYEPYVPEEECSTGVINELGGCEPVGSGVDPNTGLPYPDYEEPIICIDNFDNQGTSGCFPISQLPDGWYVQECHESDLGAYCSVTDEEPLPFPEGCDDPLHPYLCTPQPGHSPGFDPPLAEGGASPTTPQMLPATGATEIILIAVIAAFTLIVGLGLARISRTPPG